VTDHGNALLTYAEMLTNDRHSAEDIVQETLVRAWRHAERLSHTEGSVRGWLLTVVRNIAIDRRRSAYARHETITSDEHDVLQPDHADAVTTSVAVAGYLRKLSPEHREVLAHTYLYGRTLQETARILGVPVGTVKSRQHYALNNLRFIARAGRSRQADLVPEPGPELDLDVLDLGVAG